MKSPLLGLAQHLLRGPGFYFLFDFIQILSFLSIFRNKIRFLISFEEDSDSCCGCPCVGVRYLMTTIFGYWQDIW